MNKYREIKTMKTTKFEQKKQQSCTSDSGGPDWLYWEAPSV